MSNPFTTPDPSVHSRPSSPANEDSANESGRPFTTQVNRSKQFYGPANTSSLTVPTADASMRISNRPPARRSTAALSSTSRPRLNTRMHSNMVSETNPVVKPWLENKPARAKISYLLTWGVMSLGLVAGVLQCYFTYRSARLDKEPLCIVLDENFDDASTVFGDGGTFLREVEMSGFGNGEFEMTTDSSNNSFVKDGMLYIVPTLTSDALGSDDAIFNGAIFNLTGCTYNLTQSMTQPPPTTFDEKAYLIACSAVSNSTTGTVINPVQSARLSTRGRSSIRYGRVEVRAKLPKGDWIWPAIWMLPVNNTYGPWPMSGEIDIVESRGNGPKYPYRGSNYVQASLNWGPLPFLNGVLDTYGWQSERRKQYNNDFHTYALEWTPSWIRIYVDSRLHALLDLRFNEPFFKRGSFPSVVRNGSAEITLPDPWVNGTNATPFDQDFYLLLDVAVGATTGWFPDGLGKKPWIDDSSTAMREFAAAQDEWYPTWPKDPEQRGMVVDYVKMWEHCSSASTSKKVTDDYD